MTQKPILDTPSLVQLRNYQPQDAQRINQIAALAFEQYRHDYSDWPAFNAKITAMSALAEQREIILAEYKGQVMGAVAYLGPGVPKADYFKPEWPVMRMLVVAPEARKLGLGRQLAEACFMRAGRDGATVFALHTCDLMQVALSMYLRMGFKWKAHAPLIHGVKYAVYLKELDSQNLATHPLKGKPE
jgi:GNAT superfamily N-acetyltransferase